MDLRLSDMPFTPFARVILLLASLILFPFVCLLRRWCRLRSDHCSIVCRDHLRTVCLDILLNDFPASIVGSISCYRIYGREQLPPTRKPFEEHSHRALVVGSCCSNSGASAFKLYPVILQHLAPGMRNTFAGKNRVLTSKMSE